MKNSTSNWISSYEELLFFDDSLVDTKYEFSSKKQSKSNESSEAQDKEMGKDNSSKKDDMEYQFIGIANVEMDEFYKNALDQWRKELKTTCLSQIEFSSIQQTIDKKLEVLKQITKEVQVRKKKNDAFLKGKDEEIFIPTVVKLSIMTLFPIIEALSDLDEPRYQKLCSRTLDILLNMFSSVPALSMAKEPSDCLDSFKDFIISIIKEKEYQLDTDEKKKALEALISMAVSRGSALTFLQVVYILFNVYDRYTLVKANNIELNVGNCIKKLSNVKSLTCCPVFSGNYDDPFRVEKFFHILNTQNGLTHFSRIATDGTYIYALNDHGLFKIGTGYKNSIRGHIYQENNEVKLSPDMNSIAFANGKLFVLYSSNDKLKNTHSSEIVMLDDKLVELKREKLSILDFSTLVLVSDGHYLYFITTKGPHKTNPSTPQQQSFPSQQQQMYIPQQQQLFPPQQQQQELFSPPQQQQQQLFPPQQQQQLFPPPQQQQQLFPPQQQSTGSPLFSFNNVNDNFQQFILDYNPPNINVDPQTHVRFQPDENINSQVPSQNTEKDLTSSKSFYLLKCKVTDSGISNDEIEYFVLPNSFKNFSANEDEVYCTGLHLVHFKRKITNNGIVNIYSIKDNSVSDTKKKTDLSSVCYDSINNIIWTYNPESCVLTPLSNPGTDMYSTESKSPSILSTAETILESINQNSEKMGIMDIILSIFGNMNRLIRQHPFYFGWRVPQESVLTYSSQNIFSPEQSKEELIKTLHSILKYSIKYIDLKNVSFIILTCLKLLKINLYELLVSESKLPHADEIRDIIIQTIENPPNIDNIPAIQKECMNIIIVGFNLFYPSDCDKINWLIQCFEKESKSETDKIFLDKILYSVSTGGYLKDLHFDNSDDIPSHMKKFLYVLIEYSNKETISILSSISKGNSPQLPLPFITPSLKLLIAIQKSFFMKSKRHLVEYLQLIISSTVSFFNAIQELKIDFFSNNLYQQVLFSSSLNIIIKPLSIYLNKKSISNNTKFVNEIMEHLIELIAAIDKFNCSLGIHPVSNVFYHGEVHKHHWIVELEDSLAAICGKMLSVLIVGEAPSEKEKQSKLWLDSRLLNGGLDDTNPEDDSRMKFLKEFINNSEKTKPLYNYLSSFTGRKLIRASAKNAIELTERYIYAAMFKHLGLIDDVISLLNIINTPEQIPSDIKAKLNFISQKVSSLSSLLLRRGEIQKSWQCAVEECPEDSSVFESFQQDMVRLKDLCEMKEVEFDLVDTNETLKRLFLKLQNEIKENENSEIKVEQQNPYEVICKPVIERAQFLLRMSPSSRIIHPTADRANPFSIHRTYSQSHLRSSTSKLSEENTPHPLSRSISQLPTTETAQAKERRRAKEEQTSKDFSQRVSELRKWIKSYKSWKNWQDSTLMDKTSQKKVPHSPLQGVVSFVLNNSITIHELERVIRVQTSRANLRVKGFNFVRSLISKCTCTTSRHQILGAIARPISQGFHYLDSIQSCGESLANEVKKCFEQLFRVLLSLMKDQLLDPITRLLSLTICSINFRENDIDLLAKSYILSMLHKIMIEAPPTLKVSNDIDVKIKDNLTKALIKQHETLKLSAWTVVRIITAQCIEWSSSDDNDYDKESIDSLQEEIFDLLCIELNRTTKNLTTHSVSEQEEVNTVDNEQCFQLLSLLYLLGGNSRMLVRNESIANLLSMLGSNSSPRSQRLVLRLFRKILPYQFKLVDESLFERLLHEAGKWIIEGRYIRKDPKTHSESKVDLENTEDEKKPIYSVYLLFVSTVNSKLVETILSKARSNDNNSNKTQINIQHIIKEVNENRSYLVQKGDKESCYAVAKELAETGCCVRVSEVGEESSEYNQTNSLSLFYTDGNVALSLASEYISLLRTFSLPGKNVMFETLLSVLRKYISNIPKIINSISNSDEIPLNNLWPEIYSTFASLSVLSGFYEPIRVGGKALIKRGIIGEENVCVTVINILDPKHVEVILDSDTKDIRKFNIDDMKPVSEYEIDPKVFGRFTEQIIKYLLAVLAPVKQNLSQLNNCLYNDLKMKSLQVVSNLLKNSEVLSKKSIYNVVTEWIPQLLNVTKDCKPTSNLSSLRNDFIELGKQLWNSNTRPTPAKASKYPMQDILPYCPFNKDAKLLPSTFEETTMSSLIFYGDDHRTVESIEMKGNLSTSSNQRNRGGFGLRRNRGPRGQQIVILSGNSIIPALSSDYYFEVSIEKLDNNAIFCIGFAIEGSRSWDPGSYYFQSTGQKGHYINYTQKVEVYEQPFKAGNVIGCGWNQSEKVIYFTKDGVDLGPAFTNVFQNGERVVPRISFLHGAKATINFGQTPFIFDLSVLNDKEMQQKRLQEAEERRKKEEQEKQELLKQSAEPILQMGYDMKKIMKAFEATGYADTETVVMWLLENSDSIVDDEPVEEEKKVEVTEKVEEVKNEVTVPECTEQTYDVSSSTKYILKNSYSYYPHLEGKKSKSEDAIDLLLKDWETRAMPSLREWMRNDGIEEFEITEYLHHITDAYKKKNENAIKAILTKITGNQNFNFDMPSIKDYTNSVLKISQIHVGMAIMVKEKISQKDWISPQMDKTIGKIGTVKRVNSKSNRVLIEFYDPENAIIEEYWYSTLALKEPDTPDTRIYYEIDQIYSKFSYSAEQLACLYARRIILLLSEFSNELLSSDSLLFDILELACSEYIKPLNILSPNQLSTHKVRSVQNKMDLVTKRLKEILNEYKSTPEKYNSLIETLFNKTIDYYGKCRKMCKPTIISNSSWNPSYTHRVEANGAAAVSIIFDRSSSIPQNGAIEVLREKDSEPIFSFKAEDLLSPFIISSDSLFLKFMAPQQSPSKISLQTVPIYNEIALAKTIIQFFTTNTLNPKYSSELFNSTLDFIYLYSLPNPIKESLFNMLSSIVYNIIDKSINPSSIIDESTLSRLEPLMKEMISLYSIEKDGLISTYLQSLTEFMVVTKYLIKLMENYNGNDIENEETKEDLQSDENNKETLYLEEDDEEMRKAIELSLEINKQVNNNVTPPKKPATKEPEWFQDICLCFSILDILSSRTTNNRLRNSSLTHLIKKCWQTSKKDSIITQNLILLDNLPTTSLDKKSDIISAIEEYFNEISIQFKNVWLPEDKENNKTKPFMVLELNHGSKINDLRKELTKKPLKLNESESKNHFLTVTTFKNIYGVKGKRKTSNQTNTQLITLEYMKSLLIDSSTNDITDPFKKMLCDIFISYSVDYSTNGVLDKNSLDEIQLLSKKKKLTDEELEFIMSNYEVKEYEYVPIQRPLSGLKSETPKKISNEKISNESVKTKGITLSGFLKLYKDLAIDNPKETWNELLNLGYDIHFTKKCHPSEDDAITSIFKNSLFNSISTDEELIQYVEQIFTNSDSPSPVELSSSDIPPIDLEPHTSAQFQKLSKLSLPTLRLRFELLKLYNSNLLKLLPLVNLGGNGIISQKISQSRSLMFHSVKMQFFYNVLNLTSCTDPQPIVTINRLNLAAVNNANNSSFSNEETIIRNTAFGIAFDQLSNTNPKLYRQKKPVGAEPHFSLKVDFKGENVEGEGGPYRQFFTDISRELTKVLPLLIPCPNAQSKVGKNRDKYVVAPSCKSTTFLKMYKFLGNLMGIAIRTGVMLTIDLPSFFWKPLVGQELTLEDLKDIDHSFYGFMKYIELCDRSDLEGESRSIFETFQITLSDKSIVSLKPRGEKIPVTYSNRDEYVKLAKKARINEHFIQMKYIYEGITEVIPSALLKLCTWQDLEWRVCGKPHIDINLLKRHTQYTVVSPQSQHIKYFWQVLRSFSQENRRAFLRFAWAQERLPADDQEFIRTQTRMLIKPFEGTSDPDNTFPKADTCFFNLMLPEYSSAEILKEKLLFAIHTDADSMDADDPSHNEDQFESYMSYDGLY